MGIIASACTAVGGWVSSAFASGGALSSIGGWLGGTTAGMSNAGLLGGALSLLSGASKNNEQASYNKTMEKAIKEQNEREWEQKMINTREQYSQLAQAEQSYNKEFHQNLIANQTSLMQQQAQLEVMAGATGTGGQSISTLMTDLSAQAGRNQAAIVDNFENQQISIANQMKAIQTGGQHTDRVFEKPVSSKASNILGMATNVLGAYSKFSGLGKDLGKSITDSRKVSAGAKLG